MKWSIYHYLYNRSKRWVTIDYNAGLTTQEERVTWPIQLVRSLLLFTNPPSVCCSYLQFENTPFPFLMPVDLSFHVFPFSTSNHLSSQFPISPSVLLLPHIFETPVLCTGKRIFVLHGWSGLSTTLKESCPLLLTHSSSFTEHTEQVTDSDLKKAVTAWVSVQSLMPLHAASFKLCCSAICSSKIWMFCGASVSALKRPQKWLWPHSSKWVALGASSDQKLIAWWLSPIRSTFYCVIRWPTLLQLSGNNLFIVFSYVWHSSFPAFLRWLCLVYTYCMVMVEGGLQCWHIF